MKKDSYTLVSDVTGKELNKGDEVLTFRGERVVITGGAAPHKPASTGRVYIRYKDGIIGEYYPSVVFARWRADA